MTDHAIQSDPAYQGWVSLVEELAHKHIGFSLTELDADFPRIFASNTSPEHFIIEVIEKYDLDDLQMNIWTGQGGIQAREYAP